MSSRYRKYSRIPAGKYAGRYRSGLPGHGGINATHNGFSHNLKHVVCGLCRNRYAAYKSACDHCGGSVDVDSDTGGVTHG